MTDRTNVITVVLDREMRVDDVEVVLSAIRMIKHVISVDANVADYAEYAARTRVAFALERKLYDTIHEVLDPRKPL